MMKSLIFQFLVVYAQLHYIIELTVVTKTRHHFTTASLRKQDCYGPLLHDLRDSVPSVNLGWLFGPLYTSATKLCEICHLPKRTVHSMLQQPAKVQ